MTLSAATLAMCLPVSVSPVTETIPTFGWPTSGSPIAAPVPVMTLSTPGGRISDAISARTRAVSGVRADGLRMTALPAASAGPIFQPAIMIG